MGAFSQDFEMKMLRRREIQFADTGECGMMLNMLVIALSSALLFVDTKLLGKVFF